MNTPSSTFYRVHLLLICLLTVPILVLAQAPKAYDPTPTYEKVAVTSFYLPMRDGAELAIDLLLPEGLEPGTKLPTILHQTRYWRALDLRWPFQGAIDPGAPSLWILTSTERLVQQGYAIVSVDVRGTGASTGVRKMECGPEEIEDGREILDWIVAQTWSDGNVATMGVSYNGWTALMTAALGHPAVKCAIPISAPFDGFREMTKTGGIYNKHLIERWTAICGEMDHNIMPSDITAKWLFVKGIPLVEEEGKRREQLEKLYAEREQHGYAKEFMEQLIYRDDSLPEFGSLRIDSIFPAGQYRKVNAAQVPVYAFAGWYDLSSAMGATRMFMNYTAPGTKLCLGPWNHANRQDVSPFGKIQDMQMDRFGEILKFLDRHLKGIRNGIDGEPAVHYFHMAEEEWKGSAVWPLENTQTQSLYFTDNFGLSMASPESEHQETIVLHNDVYTGWCTRWELGETDSQYDTLLLRAREETALALPYWTSGPFIEAMDVTGIPSVTLQAILPDPDATVFLYLLDVSPDGKRSVMTQAQTKLGLHGYQDEATPYLDAVPYKRLFRADNEVIGENSVQELKFYFHPVSWRIQKGHTLQILVCGSDLPHFEPAAQEPKSLIVKSGKTTNSKIDLPFVVSSPQEKR